MLFYGEHTRTEDARAKLSGIARALRDAEAMPAGIARHGALVAAFIEAGELAQGVADAAFDARGGCDGRSSAGDAAMALLLRLAVAVRTSWDSGFARLDPVPAGALGALHLPETLRTKRAEGFAFYALYPEAYLVAARAAGLPPGERIRVIGVRSIGAALGALVAAALDAPPPVTLRPVGHPFRRELSLDAELETELLADPVAAFAVADEGPGLSGSSFGAVADFLEDRGVAPGRVHFFPSHGGDPGPQASPRHRARWANAYRHVVDFDALAKHRLPSWVEDLVGAPEGPLEEVSGGEWRRLRHPHRPDDWPPVNAQAERRKFLLRAGGGRTWLLKFSGLGREGERKLDRARALHGAGFAPAVAGFRHGFLVEEWIGAARPLRRGGYDAARLAERVGRYLGFRARCFPAGAGQGASLAALRDMARHNVGEGMGGDWARRLEQRTAGLESFEPRLRRTETDNRLHAWEWLALPDGRLLKADALDHHAAHDLVGCQDVAWDLAGALCELGLGGQRDALLAAVEQEAGRAVDPELVHSLAPCYLAFQLGACVMAAQVATPEEAARLRAETERYTALLRHELGG